MITNGFNMKYQTAQYQASDSIYIALYIPVHPLIPRSTSTQLHIPRSWAVSRNIHIYAHTAPHRAGSGSTTTASDIHHGNRHRIPSPHRPRPYLSAHCNRDRSARLSEETSLDILWQTAASFDSNSTFDSPSYSKSCPISQ